MISDRLMDGQTDRRTDIVTYRVACTRLKTRPGTQHVVCRLIIPCKVTADCLFLIILLLLQPNRHFKSRTRDSQVTLLVHWSVGPPLVTLLKFLPKNYINCITAPSHPYLTDAVVYTALFINWCVLSRLYL